MKCLLPSASSELGKMCLILYALHMNMDREGGVICIGEGRGVAARKGEQELLE